MRRDFLFQHPTFGSSVEPKRFSVEQSPYFWWWYALTLSDEYYGFCSRIVDKEFEVITDRDQQMIRVYEDFGDVSYDADISPHFAFKQWWNGKLGERYEDGKEITRGPHLFAESLKSRIDKVQILPVGQRREELVNEERVLVLSIPLNAKRSYIDKAVGGIISRTIKSEQTGRQQRDVSRSTAKYPFNAFPIVSSVKEALLMYDAKRHAEEQGKKITNLELASVAGIAVKSKNDDEKTSTEVLDSAFRARSLQNKVTRKLKEAKDMVEGAAIGQFPK